MEKITRTRTVEEVVGYKANDGKEFKTEEDCRKYEESYENAIYQNFKALMVGKEFSEYSICDIGSEDWYFALIKIKDEKDLIAAQMYQNLVFPNCYEKNKFKAEHIGKELIISIGDCYDKYCYIEGTEEEYIEKFANHIRSLLESVRKEKTNEN